MESWSGLWNGLPCEERLDGRFIDYMRVPAHIDAGVIATDPAAITAMIHAVADLLDRKDDKLQDLLVDRLDGRWSAQARRLFAKSFLRSGASPFGEAYTMTPQQWQCPVCLRSKSEFARSTSGGTVCGDVVLHHDHAEDFGFVPRFHGTHVCQDCNEAEGEAKRQLLIEFEVEPWFSFRPEEIKSFIKSVPNRRHVVDVDRSYAAVRQDHRYGRDIGEIAGNCDVAPTGPNNVILPGYDVLRRALGETADLGWQSMPLRLIRAFWIKRSVWPNLTPYA